MERNLRRTESGSVFFALFAGVAIVGLLGSALNTFIRGPLATSINLTRQGTAESNLSISMRLAAVSAITQQPASGDCDGDGMAEPLPYRQATSEAHPSGGGLIPSTIGASRADPWGRDYGYCAFDSGPTVDAVLCGGSDQLRGAGSPNADQPVFALMSAGKDGVFQTTCNDWIDANGDNLPDVPLVAKAAGSDDIVYSWTYAEATAGSGGLWTLEDGDTSTAEIDRNLSVKDSGGTEQFSFDAASASLSLGAGGSGSFPTVKADYIGNLTQPSIEILAPLNATDSYSVGGQEVIDKDGIIVFGEQDPTIGAVEGGNWCRGDSGGRVQCDLAPKVGEVQDGKWCSGDENGVVTCTKNPPTGGGGAMDCVQINAPESGSTKQATATCAADRFLTGGGCSRADEWGGRLVSATPSVSYGLFTCTWSTATTYGMAHAICCK